MIKTSIIIPVYNTSLYLEECVNSVFNQTQKEIEVITINDGSTDNSLEVLMNLKTKYPELIVVSGENQGLGATRNLGISMARGEFIFFLDSDDYILPDTLQSCYDLASSNDLDMVFFDAYNFYNTVEREAVLPNQDDRKNIIEERNQVFSGTYFLEKYAKIIYEPSCCFIYFSMKFINRYKLTFLPKVYYEDNEFYCKAMNYAERIMYIPEMFYQRRCRKDSITGSSFNLQKAQDHLYVINKISDLEKIKDGKAWSNIKEIYLRILLYVAYMCKENFLYEENRNLAKQIINTYSHLCNKNLDEVNDIQELFYLKKLYDVFEEGNLEREKYANKYRISLIKVLEKLPLDRKEMTILIYGCGLYTEKWLNMYINQIGEIKAKIDFIDTYIKGKKQKFRNYSIYNIKEIKEADIIFISSSKYDKDMKTNIRKLYGDKYKTISLYNDLYIDV